MSELEDLEKKLYIGAGKEVEKRLRKRIVLPRVSRESPPTWASLDRLPEAPPKNARRFLPFILGGVLIVFMFLGAFLLFVFIGTKGNEAQISIKAKESVEAGEIVTVPIMIENLSKSILEDVELTLILPPSAIRVENGVDVPGIRVSRKIDNLSPGAKEALEFSARIFGAEGESQEIKVQLLYKPENLRAQFSAHAEAKLFIRRVPLGIVWEAPEIVSQDQEVTLRVKYTSTALQPFRNVSLRVDYPPGFEFTSATPSPGTESTIWNLGSINSGEEGVVEIKGKINGEGEELKSFRAELGVFNALTKEWRPYLGVGNTVRIEGVPLSISTYLDDRREGFVSSGDNLRFSVRYKNNTESTLKNISMRVFLGGDLFDLQTLTADQGVFDFASRSVVWSSGNAPLLQELLPGGSGKFSFAVSTRSTPQIRSDKDKNLTIRVESEIRAGEAPGELLGTDLTYREANIYKVRSKVIFSGKALHRSSPILNSGSLPPEVGKKTTYTVTWEVRNFSSDLQGVEIKAPLPPNINWEQSIFPSASRLILDTVANQIIWKAGTVKAGTGVLSPALTVSFKIGLTPSEADVGKSPVLVGGAVLTGVDSFTKEPIRFNLEQLNTELKLDPLTISREWEVVE